MLGGGGGMLACFNYSGRKRGKGEEKKRQRERINGDEGGLRVIKSCEYE